MAGLLHGGALLAFLFGIAADFVKLAEAYGGVGIRCSNPADLDGAIHEMISVNRPVLFDCLVDKMENCLPMIPSGKPHNEMILPDHPEALDEAIDGKARCWCDALHLSRRERSVAQRG